jgi:hypothetical protein
MRRKTRRPLRLVVIISIVGALTFAAALMPSLIEPPPSVDFAKVNAVAKSFPNFSVQQHRAFMSEVRAEQHPLSKKLPKAVRIKLAAATALRAVRRYVAAAELGAPVSAPFAGNSTFINDPIGVGLLRQANCSLSLYYGTSTTTPQTTQPIANYEQTLHSEAHLTTGLDLFPNGCADATSGFSTRMGVYLGKSTQGLYLGAAADFKSARNETGLFSGTYDPASLTAQQTAVDWSVPDLGAITSGDLNGDGIADVVGIGPSGSISVWLANSNGTLGAPTAYAVPGDTTEAAVVADVNGDGKLDVIVATLDSSTNHEMISVLTGNGDGTLNAARSTAVTTPGSVGQLYIKYIVAADIRNNGSNDIIGSNGIVLLNDGAGSFTQSTPAFTPAAGQVLGYGGNLAVGDFNKDGKPDLAVCNGQEITIYLGHGDGTFALFTAYVSDTDVGYLTATDLDGDGNVDLYVGTANGGLFGGDEFDLGQSYALMGNGDGSFQGAPVAPFVYTGTNLAPLSSGGVIDAVAQVGQSFISYLGDGKGNFTAKAALNLPTQNGNPVDSFYVFAIGDVTGDGKADLIGLGQNEGTVPISNGIFVAAGDGQGDFATPTFTASTGFVPAGDPDSPLFENLLLADVNGDGKLDAVYLYNDEDYTTSTYYTGIGVQLGNGDGTFQAPKTLVLYSGASASTDTYYLQTSAVLSGNGFADLFIYKDTPIPNANDQVTLSVALSNGDGTFKTPVSIVTNDINAPGGGGLYQTPLAIADMNGDGIPDIVTLGASTQGTLQIAIALGNGNGTFKAANKTNFSISCCAESIAAADFNGDGKVDVAILGLFGSSDSGIVFGNGDGTLAPIVGTNTGNVFNQVLNLQMGGGLSVVADFNGDGKPDILSGTTILLNQYSAASSTPSFALTASSAAATVTPGKSATATLTLTPSGGFDASVSFSCSGLPSGATCRFSPTTATVNGSAVTDTLTITTTAATASAISPWTAGGLALAGILLPFAALRRPHSMLPGASRSPLTRVTALLLCALVLGSCGGGSGSSSAGSSSTMASDGSSSGAASSSSSGASASSSSSSSGAAASSSSSGSSSSSSSGGASGTAAGTYRLTITATGGSITQTLTYTLTVS